MKLRLLALAVLAFPSEASAQAPGPEGQVYAAHGTEPFWGLAFEGGKMVWTGDEQRIEVARPAPRPRGTVHVYRTPRMTVEISHQRRCNDGMSDYEYPDTVRVRIGGGTGGRVLEGCGGGVLPPVTLDETRWQIVEIDGTYVGNGSLYQLSFEDDGRMRGRAGCNRFATPYVQSGRTLTPGAIDVTRNACSDEYASHEAKLLRLLGGPIEISYRGGLIMVLRGRDVYVTLRRP